MQLIEHKELASDTSGITFTNIPQTFDDLLVVFSLRSNRNATNAFIGVVFNSNQVNIPWVQLRGTGTGSDYGSNSLYYWPVIPGNTSTANTFGSGQILISNYASTTSYKPLLTDNTMEDNASFSDMRLVAGNYQSNSAITSLELFDQAGGLLRQYSSATLYGIVGDSDGTTTVS